MSVNIDGSDDPFYRYKRKKIILRHNTSRKRTYITNILEIAENDLKTDYKLIEKFLNKKLSISVNWKKRENELELGGIYTVSDLEDNLQSFINEYILCNQCGNPETKLKYTKSKGIGMKMSCNACGKNSYILDSDINNDIFEVLVKYLKTQKTKK